MEKKRVPRRLKIEGIGGNETDEYMFSSQQDEKDENPQLKTGGLVSPQTHKSVNIESTSDKQEGAQATNEGQKPKAAGAIELSQSIVLNSKLPKNNRSHSSTQLFPEGSPSPAKAALKP